MKPQAKTQPSFFIKHFARWSTHSHVIHFRLLLIFFSL